MTSVRDDAAVARQQLDGLRTDVVDAKMLAAKALVRQMVVGSAASEFEDVEFRVFSQFGEDGIIQYLIRRSRVPFDLRTFIEFGVENYEEANTRFLLLNDNWRGLVMDSSETHVAAVRNSTLYWKHDLTARCALIDRDNIDGLIAAAGFAGAVGLLSVDIDGNDYWVWERISAIEPIIVIVEYNSLFGASRAVAVPYDASFDRERAHYSRLYWGCSLPALEALARRKGYALVGSNSAGNNAFFVRNDHLNGQPALTAAQAYREARYRESRDRAGRLNFLSGWQRLQEIAELPLFDVERNETVRVGDLIAG